MVCLKIKLKRIFSNEVLKNTSGRLIELFVSESRKKSIIKNLEKETYISLTNNNFSETLETNSIVKDFGYLNSW